MTASNVHNKPFTLVLDPGHFNIDAAGKVTRDGTSARWNGKTILEGEITLDVSERLRKELEGRGMTVFATRWLDPALPPEDPKNHKYWRISGKGYDQERANIGRAEFANEKILGPDWKNEAPGGNGLFFRIHFDGSENPKDRGFNVYYNDQSDYDKDGRIAAASKAWAEAIAAALVNGMKNEDGSIKHHPYPIPPNGPNNGVRRFDRVIYGFKHAAVPSVLIEGGFFTNSADLAVIMDASSRKLLAGILADVIAGRASAAGE